MEEDHGAGITINPIAFLTIQENNVKLLALSHSSNIDKLLDYVPDLMDKANKMINKCKTEKKERSEEK